MRLQTLLKEMYSTSTAMAAADKEGNFIQSNGAFDDLVGKVTSIWELGKLTIRSDTIEYFVSVVKHWGDGTGLDLHVVLKKQNAESEDPWWLVQVSTTRDDMTSYVPYQPSFMLKQIFQRVMKTGSDSHSDGLPLFRDWVTYESHLPYRQSESTEWQRLADHPFYARKEDMEVFTTQIETTRKKNPSSRPTVKYVVAPSGSGKTASVAAAFITSVTEGHEYFSHYVYMAFQNNKANNFRAVGSASKVSEVAEKQGADFAFKCFQIILGAENLSSQKLIEIVDPPPDLEVTADKIRELVEKVPGTRKVLLHLDEHRKMHEDANFRGGAMGVLASCSGRVTVVATYIDPPMEIPQDSSSGVCRYPLALPALDIRAVMKNVKELCLPIVPSVLEGHDQRLWASFLFRLAAYVMNYLSSLHLRDDKIFVGFLQQFQAVCKGYDLEEKKLDDTLRKLFALCLYSAREDPIPRGCEAFKLLLGMPESDLAEVAKDGRVGHGLVAYSIKEAAHKPNEVRFTTSLQALACHTSTVANGVPFVCEFGAMLFKNQLGSDDLLAETPLERAYLWTLATRAAAEKKLMLFSDKFFIFECKGIASGRIFDGTTKETLNLDAVKRLDTNTIYYADEKHDEVNSHPYGDIFFLTAQRELVLIDVTGATRKKTVNKKAERLNDWVTYSSALPVEKLTFHGVVLAPLLDGKELIQGMKGVSIVKGPYASHLLGGLTQLSAWFSQDV